MFRVSNVVVLLLLISVLSSYLIGTFGRKMSVVDDLASLGILFLFIPVLIILKSKIRPLRNQLFILVAFIYIISTFIFLYSSLLAHIYELYKLLTFMIFIPLFMILSEKKIFEIDKKLLFVMGFFLAFNIFIIILQYTVSPYIVASFGMQHMDKSIGFAAGRYGGLFSNVNNLADFAVLMFLLNEIIRPKYYKKYWIVFVGSVLISTSKHATVILLILIAYQNKDLIKQNLIKFFVSVLFLIGAVFITYNFNQAAFDAKIEQYVRLVQAEDVNQVRLGSIESRARKMIEGMKLSDEYFPLGTGLGTWGDSSSKLNSDNPLQNTESMSDSAFVHLFVEQGIFYFLYILMMAVGYFSVTRRQKKYFISMLILYLLASLPTMGFSSGGWPLIFAYLYARLLFSKNLERYQE